MSTKNGSIFCWQKLTTDNNKILEWATPAMSYPKNMQVYCTSLVTVVKTTVSSLSTKSFKSHGSNDAVILPPSSLRGPPY